MQDKLNQLLEVPFELWRSYGLRLKAVSANADGRVNSGILSNGIYFYRKWEPGFQLSSFVIG